MLESLFRLRSTLASTETGGLGRFRFKLPSRATRAGGHPEPASPFGAEFPELSFGTLGMAWLYFKNVWGALRLLLQDLGCRWGGPRHPGLEEKIAAVRQELIIPKSVSDLPDIRCQTLVLNTGTIGYSATPYSKTRVAKPLWLSPIPKHYKALGFSAEPYSKTLVAKH